MFTTGLMKGSRRWALVFIGSAFLLSVAGLPSCTATVVPDFNVLCATTDVPCTLGESGEAFTSDFAGVFTWTTAVAGFAETVVVFDCVTAFVDVVAVAVIAVVFVVDTAPALATPAIGLLGAATTVTGFVDEPTLAFPVVATFVEGAEGFVVETFTVAGFTDTAGDCAETGFAAVVGEGFAFALETA